MDFVAVPAGTAPVAALALRGADPPLSFATADSFNTTLGVALWRRLRSRSKLLLFGSLSGTGRSLLGAHSADRPVGCDARRRGCVGYALDRSCSCSLSRKLKQSSIDRERSRRSCGGERHTRASHPTGRSAVHAPSSERPVPLKLPRESKSSFDRERTDAAEAASVTSDRAISGARAEQRAACAAQASEGESSSFDRERSRHSRGGERHTRQGDQRCTSRAARSLCRSDRPVGCDARHRSCVGYALDRSCSCSLSEA